MYTLSAIFFAILPLAERCSTFAIESIHIVFIPHTFAANIHIRPGAAPVVMTTAGFIFLNNFNILVGSETLFVGTIDKSAVYPREILEKVIQYKAKGVIFAHNHPSGNLRPSKQDIQITEHMQEVLEMIDVKLLEHIIITKDGYFSFLQEGLI